MDEIKNQAFIDGQNLNYGTMHASSTWKVDLYKFRVYLQEKFHVTKAYYFLGVMDNKYQKLYQKITDAGFILVFREHTQDMRGVKKGNVDTDIVFTIMAKIAEREPMNQIILVSGDGDYIRMVKYLITKRRFAKLLVPNRLAMSSLYKRKIDNHYYTFIEEAGIKRKIVYKKVASP